MCLSAALFGGARPSGYAVGRRRVDGPDEREGAGRGTAGDTGHRAAADHRDRKARDIRRNGRVRPACKIRGSLRLALPAPGVCIQRIMDHRIGHRIEEKEANVI